MMDSNKKRRFEVNATVVRTQNIDAAFTVEDGIRVKESARKEVMKKLSLVDGLDDFKIEEICIVEVTDEN